MTVFKKTERNVVSSVPVSLDQPPAEPVRDFDRVRVLFADQLNLARGKYLPWHMAQKGEARFCLGTFAVTYSRALVPAPHSGLLEGLPDMTAVFDPSDLRPGWERGTKIAIADLHFNGDVAPLCGRSALKRAIADWQKHGLTPMVGLEAEAYVFQRGGSGEWIPYDTPGAFVYGTGPFTDPEGLIDEVWSRAIECGLPVESINGEFDPPQFELAMRYSDALSACDDMFLFRQMARELLIRRGFLLSFMPKPLPDLAGTGMHINLSFADKHGKNVFSGATGDRALSNLVKGAIAGLMHHHEALGGILAPTVNSYQRLKPKSLSGYWANWGFDHRSVALRVSAETGAAARIEHRMGDCAASPYFAVAAVLQAARLGFEQGYQLQEPERLDGLEEVGTQRHIAHDLEGALKHLESDSVLVDAIGRPLIENYVSIKRAEAAELEGKSQSEIFNYYAPFI